VAVFLIQVEVIISLVSIVFQQITHI